MKYLLFLMTFILVSCAEKPETELKVSIGATGTNTNFDGGLILLGKSDNGFKVSKVIPLGDSAEIFLPNGRWSFAVIGWDNAGAIMEGDSYCDFKPNIALTGQDIALNFNATQANCINPIFGGNIENTDQFQTVEFNSCTGVKKYFQVEGLNNIPDGMNCDGGETPLRGEFKSFKVIIPEAIAGNNQLITAGGLNSACLTNASHTYASNLRLPKGSPQVPVPYIIRAYTNTGCLDGSGYNKQYVFQNGLSGLTPGLEAGAKYDFSLNGTKVFLNSTPCNPDMLAAQVGDFPINTAYGAPRDTYLICSADDLDNVAAGGNDTDGYYILGRDIDMDEHSGTFISIANFNGEFRGNGHSIKNGTVPLFGTIINGPTDVFISNLKLVDFDITATTANAGILAENLAGTDTKRIEIDKIEVINGQITASSGSTRIGGLIGRVQVSASATDNYSIRKCDIDVDIIATTGGQDNQVIGGIIGEANGSSSYQVALELNTVGVNNRNNPYDRSKAASISYYGPSDVTSSAVGGLVGKGDILEIRDFNIAIVDFATVQNTGGLIGLALDQVKIENSFANMIYNTTNSCANGNTTSVPFTAGSCNSIGGIAGVVDANADVSINGVNSKLYIANNAAEIDVIGGLVGYYLDSGGNFFLNVKDSKVEIDIATDGDYHGGFFGYINATNLGGDDTVKRSVVVGDLDNVLTGDQSYKGGFAGQSQNVSFFMSIADVGITGDTFLGGGVGKDADGTRINECYLKNTITSNDTTNGSNTAYSIGGAFGYIYQTVATASEAALYNSKVDTIINAPVILSSPFENKIGKSFGEIGTGTLDPSNALSGGASYAVESSIIYGSIVSSNSSELASSLCGSFDNSGALQDPAYATHWSTDYTVCINGNLSTDVVFTTGPSAYPSSGAWGQESANEFTPLFHFKWKELGFVNSNYLAGSKFEPFPISTPGDWNAIKTDEFLLNKTFELTQNIDFNFGTFHPIGVTYEAAADIENPFRGQLLSNGYKVMNIQYSPSDVDNNVGVGLINTIKDDGKIGDRYHPFVFENVTIECNGGTISPCGIVAGAQTARLHIDARNVTISAGASGQFCIGGLLGQAELNDTFDVVVEIEHSRFLGIVDGFNATTSADGVGGVIGCIGNATAPGSNVIGVRVAETAVILKGLRGGAEVGGLIGNLYSDGENIMLENNYVKVIPDNTFNPQIISIDNSPKFAGFIGSTDANVTVNDSFADFTGGNTDFYDGTDGMRVFFGAGTGTVTNSNLAYVAYPVAFSDIDGEKAGASAHVTGNGVYRAPIQSQLDQAVDDVPSPIPSFSDKFVKDGNQFKLEWELEGFHD